MTDDYLFKCLNAILWLCTSGRGKSASMTIQSFQFAGHPLVPSVYLEPTMVGPEKNFQNKSSQMAGKRYF